MSRLRSIPVPAQPTTVTPASATRSGHSDALRCPSLLAFPSRAADPNGSPMTQTIDVHAHMLAEDTIRLLQREAPKVGPKLSDIGDQFGTLEVAGNIYRHFPRGGWDLGRRLEAMAGGKGDGEAVAVCPQRFVCG